MLIKNSWWTLISFNFWILNKIKNDNVWDLATFTSIKIEWETLLSFTFWRLDQIENTFWKLATFTSIKIEWDPELARSSSASLSLNKKMTRMVHQSKPIHFLSFPSFLLCFCDHQNFPDILRPRYNIRTQQDWICNFFLKKTKNFTRIKSNKSRKLRNLIYLPRRR